MEFINSIIFGLVQGITEFVPVSSSGHLVILHNFISLPINNELTFDIVLHLATLLAVISFFRKDIALLLSSWIGSFGGKHDKYSRLSWLIIFATIPASLAGFLLDDIIESVLRSPVVVIVMLVFVGVLFILAERIGKKIDSLDNLDWKKSLFIGIAQALALIPGTSRSGITIIAGLGTGLKREEAVRFSFLLSIPVIAGATIIKLPEITDISLASNEFTILLISFIIAFIFGLLAIKYFLQLSKKFSLNIFAYYRFVLAGILAIILFL